MCNKNKMFQKYCVGEKFNREMDSDGAVLEINDSICQCIIGLHNISDKELKAVESGDVSVALTEMDRVIYLCISFDNILSFDIPFNMGLYNEFQLEDPGMHGYTMVIFLIDNATNILKAMHAVGFDNNFSKKLYELSKQQWENRIDKYDEKVNKVNFFVSTEELLKNQVAFNEFKSSQNTEVK